MLKKSVNDKILIILIVSSFSNARITFVRVKVALPATYASRWRHSVAELILRLPVCYMK